MNRLRQRLFVQALEDRTAPATFTVMNLADSGADSLRDCVSKANTAAGFDTVTFDSGLAGTITLASEITVTEQVNLAGTGKVTLSGSGAVNIFHINQVAKAALVLISDTTFTNGFFAGNGGAIFGGDEHLEVVRCTFRDNKSANVGGAISLGSGGMVTATDSRFTGNSASSSGGAVAVQGAGARLNLTGCTVSGNTAGLAGALYSRSSVQIDNSTVSGNIATNAVFGGALVTNSFSAADTQRIRNSTFSGNSTAGNGGAVYIAGSFPGTFTVQNSTFTANTAAGIGGAIARGIGTATIALESSIVSGNAGSAPDISSAGTVTMKTSAVGSGTGFSKTDLGGNLSFGINLKLGPLADNGGLTLTHLPLEGSPLVNAGSNPAALTFDQRGTSFRRAVGVVDIGSVEIPLTVTNLNDSGPGSLRQAIIEANIDSAHDTITFETGLTGTIQLTSGQLQVGAGRPVTVLGPGALVITVSGNNQSSIVSSTSVTTIEGLTLSDAKEGRALVFADSVFNLIRCAITNNPGGAVGVSTTPLPFSSSFLSIVDCTLSGNNGAAVHITNNNNILGNATLGISNSTISGNFGAIAATAAVPNSQVSVVINNSTITGNGAGGILVSAVLNATASLAVSNSIISGNTGATAPDIAAASVTLKNSALGSPLGIGTINDQGGNLPYGIDLKLGPLADNGGPTKTHALGFFSPAIDAGANPLNLTNDQRGAGFPRTFNGKTDIGAFEVQSPPPPAKASVQINDGSPQRSRITSLKVTFDNPVTLPTNPVDAFQLKRQSDNNPVFMNASVAGNSVTLTFFAGTLDFNSLADGRYTLTVQASKILNLDGNGDGTPGDDYILASTPAGMGPPTNIFRFFGDADGDGSVAANDFIQFRLALGGSTAMFDFDNDGAVAASDFIQFRLRFGGSI